jgi:ketosteroid isomerase-like protein
MTLNRDVVLRYMDGFRKTDREQILSCLTDAVVWKIPGLFETKGKAAFATHIVDEGFKTRPDITVARLIEGDNVVVAEGTVRTERTDGTLLNLAFCDVFDMRDGRIAQLASYLVQIQTSPIGSRVNAE